MSRETPNIDRLPKWAQDYISVLAMRAKEAEAKVDTLFSGTPTNTRWRDGQRSHYLPANASILFQLGPDGLSDRIECRIEDSGSGDMVLYVNGVRGVFIYPIASNDFEVRLKP